MAFELSLKNNTMKSLQYNLLKNFLLLIVTSFFANLTTAQETEKGKSEKEATIKTLIDAHRYVFKAQSVHPSRGRTVQLNSDYDVKVSGDTMRSYLPYFGRAYSAPIDGRGGGIDFISKDFEYNQKARKKGGWDITIKPRDVSDIRELFLTIFENGSASLRVLSNNREPISYNGYVEGI
jgi:hypothetical protein